MELMRQRLESKTSTADIGTVLSILMMAQNDVRGMSLTCLATLKVADDDFQMCTGSCAEFDTHLPAARALVDEYGSSIPDRGYCEQRLAW